MSVPTKPIRSPDVVAMLLSITGLVQGIGMRPAISRFAQQLSLTGHVSNTDSGVEIHVEGAKERVDRFVRELHLHWPTQANVEAFESSLAPVVACQSFMVRRPAHPTAGKLLARVPTDVVVCADCLAEIQDPSNRRYNYPFTSCTHCGPRYSIIERMPYERADTGMSKFSMCTECQREYETSTDRRFHSQTNACQKCGPQIWLRNGDDQIVSRHHDAIRATANVLCDGGIVALRGLGGYQLLVDATSQVAVERLRTKKFRQGKPLAVMVASREAAKTFAVLDEHEADLLCGPVGPIVIAHAKTDSKLAASVSGGLNTLGILLPTTPLHWLLLDEIFRSTAFNRNDTSKPADEITINNDYPALICTSANLDGEPLVYQSASALEKLSSIADVWLEHDRPIRRPIDDSVMRVMAGRSVAIRLARGFAPKSLDVETGHSVVALGGHQKCSLATTNGAQAVLGPHLGDMNSLCSRQRFEQHVSEHATLYGAHERQLVCDEHPEYFTTQWAYQQNEPISQAQHHHAHIVAGMLEHDWLDREVLGIAFDGTGYGKDKTIWGGEFLRATVSEFERVGHIRSFPLVGGELAIRQPWRVAVALVSDSLGQEGLKQLNFESGEAAQIFPLLTKPNLSPVTTSAGRLFDGIAALVLGREQSQFEGQAAMLLESACDFSDDGHYKIEIQNTELKQLDWRPLVQQLMLDRANGVSRGAMAMRFHRGLAIAIYEFSKSFSKQPVVLAGGVFQNRVLVELIADQFSTSLDVTQPPLGLPGLIPVNDGGLAAGQLVIAAALTKKRSNGSCV